MSLTILSVGNKEEDTIMGLIAGSNAGNLTLTQDIRALKEKVAGLCPGGGNFRCVFTG